MPLEAGYPNTTGFRKVVKVTILVKKKPGMSDEDFIQHYNHKHAQMAAPVLQKHNVITYSLVCLASRSRLSSGALQLISVDVLPQARPYNHGRHASRQGKDARL